MTEFVKFVAGQLYFLGLLMVIEKLVLMNVVVNWENGEKLLFIDGIQDYIIGFAIDNNNQLFWHHVTRLYDAGPSNSIAALGVCKNGKYAARPAGCFNKNEYFEKQPFLTETCNLFK